MTDQAADIAALREDAERVIATHGYGDCDCLTYPCEALHMATRLLMVLDALERVQHQAQREDTDDGGARARAAIARMNGEEDEEIDPGLFAFPPTVTRKFVWMSREQYEALEADLKRLEHERHWAQQFHCSNCGVIGAEYVTTKKTCAHCDLAAGGTGKPHDLIRSKHPYVQALEAERDRLHSWDGLIELLNEHWPAEVFDGSSGDPGPVIVALVRVIDGLQQELNAAIERTSK